MELAISPTFVLEGSGPTTLRVRGEGMWPFHRVMLKREFGSIFNFNAMELPTRYVNKNELEAEITPEMIGEPGTYTVTAAAQGFQGREQRVAVTVGQATTVNSQLALASASQTVEVTAEGGVVQTENGNVSTTFTPAQIANLPNPGNDLSYIVQTAPGASTYPSGGASSGLPARSFMSSLAFMI